MWFSIMLAARSCSPKAGPVAAILLTLPPWLPKLPSAPAEQTFPLMAMARKSKDGQGRLTTLRISGPCSPEMCVVTSFMSYSRPGIPFVFCSTEGFLIFFTKPIFAGGGNNQLLWGCSLLYLFANSQQQSNLSKGLKKRERDNPGKVNRRDGYFSSYRIPRNKKRMSYTYINNSHP